MTRKNKLDEQVEMTRGIRKMKLDEQIDKDKVQLYGCKVNRSTYHYIL